MSVHYILMHLHVRHGFPYNTFSCSVYAKCERHFEHFGGTRVVGSKTEENAQMDEIASRKRARTDPVDIQYNCCCACEGIENVLDILTTWVLKMYVRALHFAAFGMYDMGFRTVHFHALCMQNVTDILNTLVVQNNTLKHARKSRNG